MNNSQTNHIDADGAYRLAVAIIAQAIRDTRNADTVKAFAAWSWLQSEQAKFYCEEIQLDYGMVITKIDELLKKPDQFSAFYAFEQIQNTFLEVLQCAL